MEPPENNVNAVMQLLTKISEIQGCKSRSGSFKQPMKELLLYLLKINRINQEEFEKAMEKLESVITG
uniref:Uncharacterized protein n=1 Tax=Romanomermis culicivorax TaxID=13658 RepID=A0A915IHM4_ROMCU